MHVYVNMAFHLLRRRRGQSSQKIAALCIIIACLNDEGEDTRKKWPDRHWLRRRAERGSYSFRYAATQVWNMLPDDIRTSQSLTAFKRAIQDITV